MMSFVYINKRFERSEDASISIFDRGFLFGDGVYEVSAVLDGKLVDNSAHCQRLQRSLDAIDLFCPISMRELEEAQKALIKKNALQEGLIYYQITRGSAPRDFAFPQDAKPSLIMFTMAKNITKSSQAEKGIKVLSVEDLRWKRRDIKSISLLAQVLAKQEASTKGYDEAFMVEDGLVTEGSSSSAYIITQDHRLITRPLSRDILAGITRQALLSLIENTDLILEERPFTLDETYQAKEVFITSASAFVMPVIQVDEHLIHGGKVGVYSKNLRKLYMDFAQKAV